MVFIHFRQFQVTLGSAGSQAPQQENRDFLFQLYPFHAISSNFAFSWQKNPQPRNQMEFFQTGFIHVRPFSATLGSAGRKAPSQEPNRQFFRLNLSISGNFPQLWVQLAAKVTPGAKQAKILDGIYSFQAISSNFGFSWQLGPPVGKQGFFILDLSISCNFQQLCLQLAEKSPTQEPNGLFCRLNLSILGHFQQLWAQLAIKFPPVAKQAKIVD